MQVIQIDLRKTPEVKDFLADREPGEKFALFVSLKSKNDQMAEVTLEEVGDDPNPDEDDETDGEPVAGEDADEIAEEDDRFPS